MLQRVRQHLLVLFREVDRLLLLLPSARQLGVHTLQLPLEELAVRPAVGDRRLSVRHRQLTRLLQDLDLRGEGHVTVSARA